MDESKFPAFMTGMFVATVFWVIIIVIMLSGCTTAYLAHPDMADTAVSSFQNAYNFDTCYVDGTTRDGAAIIRCK